MDNDIFESIVSGLKEAQKPENCNVTLKVFIKGENNDRKRI